MSRWTLEDVVTKIEWEGGIDQAIRWGLTADDVPPQLEELWRGAEQLLSAYDKIVEDIDSLLDGYGG